MAIVRGCASVCFFGPVCLSVSLCVSECVCVYVSNCVCVHVKVQLGFYLATFKHSSVVFKQDYDDVTISMVT